MANYQNFILILISSLFLLQCDSSSQNMSSGFSEETMEATTDKAISEEVITEEEATENTLDAEQRKLISTFVNAVKEGDKAKIARLVDFPLRRSYPIPSVKDEKDFLERYDEIFDNELIKVIAESDPLTGDWSAVGWRGIMLSYGIVWMDYDGNLIGINHQAQAEKDLQLKLIEEERNKLHPSLRTYKLPVVILETNKFRIRIDELENGSYRYASWSVTNKIGDEPDLVLKNGEFVAEGSGGNHYYDFTNKEYYYKCSIIVMGEGDHPPATLQVYKDNKEIVNQDAKIVKK